MVKRNLANYLDCNIKETEIHERSTNNVWMSPSFALVHHLIKFKEISDVQNKDYTSYNISKGHKRSTENSNHQSKNDCKHLTTNKHNILCFLRKVVDKDVFL
jgi:hypothetical protein